MGETSESFLMHLGCDRDESYNIGKQNPHHKERDHIRHIPQSSSLTKSDPFLLNIDIEMFWDPRNNKCRKHHQQPQLKKIPIQYKKKLKLTFIVQ